MQQYLHPWLVAIFLILFTVMSLVGMIGKFRDRNAVGAIILLISTLVFGYSTWIAATLNT